MKTFSGRPASQREDELRPFIELLQAEGVTSYLEIGARHGDTFHAVMSALPAGARGVALDEPGAAWGKDDSRQALSRASQDLVQKGYQASIVIGDSHDLATQQIVKGFGPYDALLIDADHTLQAVMADWHDYGPMARLVAFHDIDGRGRKDRKSGMAVEVPALWRPLKAAYRHVEFIGRERGMGIGVVWPVHAD